MKVKGDMSILDTIKLRRSVRTYNKEEFTQETQEYIDNYLKEQTGSKGPFGSSVDLFRMKTKNNKQLGTYGIIKNPQSYIAGICDNTNNGLVDFGYIFEKLILDFTNQNIGTCWLAGTFKREEIDVQVSKSKSQLMPAVTPIGCYENKRIFETMMRKVVSADNKKPFSELFFLENFKHNVLEENSKYFEILESVRLGPSASNKQPWRILIKDQKYHFYLERTPRYSKTLGFEVQHIDLGIAMYHFEISCQELNIVGDWIYAPPKIDLPNSNYEYIITYE